MKWFETDSLVYRYTHYRLLHHDINIIKSVSGREGSASIPIQNNLEDGVRYNSVYEIEMASGLVKRKDDK